MSMTARTVSSRSMPPARSPVPSTFGTAIDEPLGVERRGRQPFLPRQPSRQHHGAFQRSGRGGHEYDYTPYGQTTESVATSNPFRFTGREYEAEDLYYYRARYYDPELGRFLSEDPLGFGGGDTNLYRYTGGNPVNLTDPSGELIPAILLIWRGGEGRTGYLRCL